MNVIWILSDNYVFFFRPISSPLELKNPFPQSIIIIIVVYWSIYSLWYNIYLYSVGEWLGLASRWLHWDHSTICKRDDRIHRRQIVIEINKPRLRALPCSFSGVQNRLYIENISRKPETFQFKDMALQTWLAHVCIVIMICICMKISCLKNCSVPFMKRGIISIRFFVWFLSDFK